MALSQSDAAYIREQIRLTVDPMFIRMRTDLFGTVYNNTLQGSLIPTEPIKVAIKDGIDQAIGGGSVTPATIRYMAGTEGVQTGKVVYFDGTVVNHAESTSAGHAGKIVGITSEVGAPGELVNVQMYGILDLPGSLSLSPVGPLLLGTNGDPVAVLPGGSVFAQFVGVALSTTKMFVYVTPEIYML
jgi:hypothetical protein